MWPVSGWNIPPLMRRVRELGELFGAETILIEDTASGVQLFQEFSAERFYKVQAVDVKGDKIMRMRAQTAVIEAGRKRSKL
jgi:phage terminase large subunit-like protein